MAKRRIRERNNPTLLIVQTYFDFLKWQEDVAITFHIEGHIRKRLQRVDPGAREYILEMKSAETRRVGTSILSLS